MIFIDRNVQMLSRWYSITLGLISHICTTLPDSRLTFDSLYDLRDIPKIYITKRAKIDTVRCHKRIKLNLCLNAFGCTYMAYFIWCQSWCIVQCSPIDCHIFKSSQKDFPGLAVVIVRKYSDVCLKHPCGNWQLSLFLLLAGDIKTSFYSCL